MNPDHPVPERCDDPFLLLVLNTALSTEDALAALSVPLDVMLGGPSAPKS